MRLYFERHFHEHRLAVSVLFDQNAELDNGNILFDWICPSQRFKATKIIIS